MTNNPPVKLSCIIDDDNVYVNLIIKIINIKQLSESTLVFKNGKKAIDHFKSLSKTTTSFDLPEIIF